MKHSLKAQTLELMRRQCEDWTLARDNYKGLEQVKMKTFHFDGFQIQVQCNPQRLSSASAKVDSKSIQARPCFLCEKNRPDVQEGIPWNDHYTILLNPFPIFPHHFTVPCINHEDQLIEQRMPDMLQLAKEFEDYTVFYNGAKCGASAPDHFHFQIGNAHFLPFSEELMGFHGTQLLYSQDGVQIYATDHYLRKVITLRGNDCKALNEQFLRLCFLQRKQAENSEPMMNILTLYKNEEWFIHLFPRKNHRPSCFYKEGEEQILISPGAVDVGGVLITPRLEDFEKITKYELSAIYEEISLDEESWSDLLHLISTPSIKVGIMNNELISFQEGSKHYQVSYEKEAGLILQLDGVKLKAEKEKLLFYPASVHNSILLEEVVIGVDFHWEQKEDQRFKGYFEFIVENEAVTAINVISVEDYLISVISSEMSANSSMSLLKAHAITSRSWLLAQLDKQKKLKKKSSEYCNEIRTEEEYIRWFDREDHLHFDVCADDHCQRYQGVTRANTPSVEEAIKETRGQVICYNNKICDARFSKSCGGITEFFENCWEDEEHPYLKNIVDYKHKGEFSLYGNISNEPKAQDWIYNHQESFCNTSDPEILSQVLNDYDLQTSNFYRWTVQLTQAEITQLIPQRIGIDFGNILDLIPIERGPSGRLIRLKIVGTKRTMVIGKELIIRKALSSSHLYSSAFVVEKDSSAGAVPISFTLCGIGWGHGVGLCQIGAAVMGAKGFSPEEILGHYFPNTELKANYGL